MLKFIIIIILAYYLLKLLSRALLPFLLKYIVKKAEGNAFYGDMNGGSAEKEEGEVTIDYSPSEEKKRKSSDDKGEYVDFEDVE